MSNIFEAVDPRGWKVVCTEDCLQNHILLTHPEMAGYEEAIKQTIQEPTFGFIYEDAHRAERNIYYRLEASAKTYIKVVVTFDSQQEGTVITAFRTSSAKSGEKLIWTKKSSP